MGESAVDEADQAKERVRRQYGASGDAYVASPGHAAGGDLARMRELAALHPDDRVLDVATGGGHVARAFAPHVAQVVAADLTPQMLDQAEAFLRTQGIANVAFEPADAEALPFADRSFDVVTCRIAPHHFPHPNRFVAEVARVLKPGGRFLLVDSTVPAGEVGAIFNRFEAWRDPSHVRSLTATEWSALLTAADFDVRTVELYRKRHVYADWVARARLPEPERPRLAAFLLAAGPAVRDAFQVERHGDELIAFTDEKTLFLAVKPGDRR